jgi:hypothetical protein
MGAHHVFQRVVQDKGNVVELHDDGETTRQITEQTGQVTMFRDRFSDLKERAQLSGIRFGRLTGLSIDHGHSGSGSLPSQRGIFIIGFRLIKTLFPLMAGAGCGPTRPVATDFEGRFLYNPTGP